MMSVACQASPSTHHTPHVSIQLQKRIVVKGADPTFHDPVILPAGPTGSADNPSSINAAEKILLSGLSDKIIEAMRTTFIRSCKQTCDVSRQDFWNDFLKDADGVEIEPGYSLGDYMSSLERELSTRWRLSAPCEAGAKLCIEINKKIGTSGYMSAHAILRKLSARTAGVSMSLQEAQDSLDNMRD